VSGQGFLTTDKSADSSCATVTSTLRFMVDKPAQIGNKLATGYALPYAWTEIKYKLCCDCSETIDVKGSDFPSAKMFLNGEQIDWHPQYNLKQFLYAGGYSDAPNTWTSSYKGKAKNCTPCD